MLTAAASTVSAGAAWAVETAAPFEGTWGGAQGDLTAQVIVTGGVVIGFYWRDDYVDATNAKFSADGRTLAFDFAGGQAVLTQVDESTASLEVTEGRRTTRLTLKRD